jgi:hypothetical protein
MAALGADSVFQSQAPRSMNMGTIRSPWPYDAAARHALQSASLRRSAILHAARFGNDGIQRVLTYKNVSAARPLGRVDDFNLLRRVVLEEFRARVMGEKAKLP